MEPDILYTKQHIEEIRCEIKKRLSSVRYEHSERVSEIAKIFAEKSGCDVNRVEIAALLHDVAREFSETETSQTIEKYKVELNQYNRNYPPSIHGRVGAAVADHEFNIQDKEILNAIKNHVSGRPCMKMIEKIIYLADHIDKLRKLKPEMFNGIMEESLDDALYHILGYVIEFDNRERKPIDERTLQTFDWMIEQMGDEPKETPINFNDEEFDVFYDKMDALLNLYAEHAIIDLPLENLRDLGGYHSADGRVIRRNKIFRSGNPDQLTTEDFDQLKKMGINYLIDLRNGEEKKKRLDLSKTGIQYIEIPFVSNGEYKSYLETLIKWIMECDDPEESAWLTALYFDSFELDSMYLKILFDPDIQKKFREILNIMLRDDCTGIHFFCNSGKDRTGIISAMILHVLNVDISTMIDDYMMSCIPYYAMILKYLNQLNNQGYSNEIRSQVVSVLGVEYDRPIRVNKEILSEFKKYKNYFNINEYFTVDELNRFKDKYLE